MRHTGKAAIDTKQRRPTVTVVRGRLEKPEGQRERQWKKLLQSADIIKEYKFCFRLITKLFKAQDYGSFTLSP